jgi:hypothetical protein
VCNKTEGRKENKKVPGEEERSQQPGSEEEEGAQMVRTNQPFGSPYRSALHKSGFFINQFLMNSIISIQKA